MGKFLIKRLLYMVLVMWVVITATFFLMNTLPGDPIANKGGQLPQTIVKILYHKYGLDQPVYIRYVKYLGNLLNGDLGDSMIMLGENVSDVIRIKFPASARFGLQAIIVGSSVGILLGIIAAFNRNTWIDYLVIFIAVIGISIPEFVIGIIIQKYLGNLSCFAIAGWEYITPFFPQFKYTILPTIALSVGLIASHARYMKAQVTDVMTADYILTAKAKGVRTTKIVWKHVLRNAIIPVVTMLPVTIARVMCGSFVIEKIYAIPGLGREYITCIYNRDYMMILGTTIFWCGLYVIALLCVDLLYGVIDPRIRITGGKR